jgi:hypothetical protein
MCRQKNKSMIESSDSLLLRIEKNDALRRSGKAARLEWLALHEAKRPKTMMGRAETFQLLNEAREVFLDGHYVATLLVGMSYIEHSIIEELQLLSLINGSIKFSEAIKIAEQKKVFPIDWLKRAKKLSLRRNPFAHLKDGEHEDTLGIRIRKEKRSQGEILEDDAKDVIDLMNNFFSATLREIEF